MAKIDQVSGMMSRTGRNCSKGGGVRLHWIPLFLLALLLPVSGIAQDVGEKPASAEVSEFKKVVEMAVLMPGSEEFDEAWVDYVGKYLNSDTDVSATIDRVLQGVGEYRRSIRVPGASASSGAAMKAATLREKMTLLADSVLQREEQ